MARFIGYPDRQVVAVFDARAGADRAAEALGAAGFGSAAIETYEGSADAERFDATGVRHGPRAFDTGSWRVSAGRCSSA